jgi:putative methionine-R-sulfoxide reductase with GAF domain
VSNSPAGRVPWPDGFDDAPFSSPERRKHARTKLLAATTVLLDAGSRPATVVDLSEGGVRVRSDAVLEPGAICRLQLSVPDSNQVIDAACELAWKNAPHAGFRFIILTEKSQRQIKEWLTSVEAGNRTDSPAADPATETPVESPVQTGELVEATEEALLNLAIKARDFTHADGVAVAVRDGEGMVCRASLGFAPDTGVRIQADRGLSGECLRTGEIVVCYDSDSDPRVDAAVARELNMRSAVIVPIGRHESPAGLLEVFFASARAFNEAAVYSLQELAIGFFVESEKRPSPPKPEEPQPSVGLPQMASFSQREASPGFVLCDVCGLENNEANQVCDRCDVPLPAALHYVDLNSPAEHERSVLRRQGVRNEQPPSSASGHRKKLLLMLLVAVILGAWQARGKISIDTHVPSVPASATKVEIEEAKPQLRDKPLELPAPAISPKEHAAKPAQRAEPEVTVRTFSTQAKPSRSKVAAAKSTHKDPDARTPTAGSTIPQATVAEHSTSAETEQALAAQPTIVLPLDDQEVVSAVSAPPPVPAKAKQQPSLWKRIGKRLILRNGTPEGQKKK